jgi:hypothetical protein
MDLSFPIPAISKVELSTLSGHSTTAQECAISDQTYRLVRLSQAKFILDEPEIDAG